MDRRDFLKAGGVLAAAATLGGWRSPPRRPPNFIVILCDDLGYGDVGAMGGRSLSTPNLDRMAAEGTVLTDFYAAANLCTPSRAGLLTGRYPIRTGLAVNVIMQNDTRGLPASEVTIAEALRPDYATALIGKWHLGHVAPHWPPTVHGFDLFFGLPYSHDMLPLSLYEANGPGVELTQEDVDYPALQQRFAERAERFITANKDRPFFLDLALSAPHLPNHPYGAMAGRSHAGMYGDVVEEIDAIVGRLIGLTKRLGIDRDTLILFTSDNGPWFEGSTGPLRARKGGAGYDGGYRVPCIVRQPGTIPAGEKMRGIAMATDLMPTFCAMAGKPLPAGVTIDGKDLSAMLRQGESSPHDQLLLFDNEDVVGIRTHRWKYVAAEHYRTIVLNLETEGYPQLYDMIDDPSESYSVAARNRPVLDDMHERLVRARAEFAPLRTQPNSQIISIPGDAVIPKQLRD